MPPRNAFEEFVGALTDDYRQAWAAVVGRQGTGEERSTWLLTAPALTLAALFPAPLRTTASPTGPRTPDTRTSGKDAPLNADGPLVELLRQLRDVSILAEDVLKQVNRAAPAGAATGDSLRHGG
jgi:hypothetical protein